MVVRYRNDNTGIPGMDRLADQPFSTESNMGIRRPVPVDIDERQVAPNVRALLNGTPIQINPATNTITIGSNGQPGTIELAVENLVLLEDRRRYGYPNPSEVRAYRNPETGIISYQTYESQGIFVSPDMIKPLSELQDAPAAMHRRMANFTAFHESAPNDPQRTRGEGEMDVAAREPVLYFYKCPRDSREGLTVGYGTFFQRRIDRDGNAYLSDEEREDIPYLEFTDRQGKPVHLTNEGKERYLLDLLKDHCTDNSYLRNDAPYLITRACADKLLERRYEQKARDVDRMLGPADRPPIVEALAIDMDYQGMLRTTPQMSRREKIIRENRRRMFSPNENGEYSLSKEYIGSIRNARGVGVERTRSRRILADVYNDIIQKYPFRDDMTPEQRRAHAEMLARASSVYVAKIYASANQGILNDSNMQPHIQETTSIAMLQIGRDYYGRDMTVTEILHSRDRANGILESYFDRTNGSSNARFKNIQHDSDEALAALERSYSNAGRALAGAENAPSASPQTNTPTNQTAGRVSSATATLNRNSTRFRSGQTSRVNVAQTQRRR